MVNTEDNPQFCILSFRRKALPKDLTAIDENRATENEWLFDAFCKILSLTFSSWYQRIIKCHFHAASLQIHLKIELFFLKSNSLDLLGFPSLNYSNSPPYIWIVTLELGESLCVYVLYEINGKWLKLSFMHSYWSDYQSYGHSRRLDLRALLLAAWGVKTKSVLSDKFNIHQKVYGFQKALPGASAVKFIRKFLFYGNNRLLPTTGIIKPYYIYEKINSWSSYYI